MYRMKSEETSFDGSERTDNVFTEYMNNDFFMRAILHAHSWYPHNRIMIIIIINIHPFIF